MGSQSSRYRAVVFAGVVVLAVVVSPRSASAQPVLGVNPPSLNLQGYAGANLAFVTLQVRNRGNRALKWSVAQPTANWLRVSPTSGVNSGTLTVTFATSALAAGAYQASFRIDSNGGSAAVNIQVSLAPSTSTSTSTTAPASLVVSCPANMTLASSDGSAVAATYSATASGGVAPVSVNGSPASGSKFPVGTTPVAVTAQSSDGQTARCSFSITVTYTAPPPSSTSAYGPRSTITCPAGAVDIWPGVSIQTMINTYPGTTTFCIRAGVHYLKASLTPKTGNTFVGEYGAALDGTGWSTTEFTAAAFRAHNQDIDDVTIRNLVIRNMPQKGIHAYYWMSNRWTIEYNEIARAHVGINAPNDSIVRYNYIHHNVGNATSTNPAERGGGYAANNAKNTVFESNEISYNGPEQKVTQTANVVFRNNYVHHNLESGIWYDGDNVGALIEGNIIDDNAAAGIFYEISAQAVIRNNTIRRNGDSAIFMSTSRDVEIYGNRLEGNFRGVNMFVSCVNVYPPGAPYAGAIGWDLRNNNVHHNTVIVGSQSGAIGNLLSTDATCTTAQRDAYLNGSKGNVFQANAYKVSSLSSTWWFWGGWKTWTQWQGLNLDTTGTASQ